MSLAGAGAVAIWHDIAPEGRAQFYEWHGREHMPERVGIPGFLRGRRYVALDGSPEFFNLYETASPATVTGADYLARLNHPTPWTTDTVTHLRGVARSLCTVAATFGEGQGGLIATFRYDVDAANASAHRRWMCAELLPELAQAPGIAGCHLLIADESASAIETGEKKGRSEKNTDPALDRAGRKLGRRSVVPGVVRRTRQRRHVRRCDGSAGGECLPPAELARSAAGVRDVNRNDLVGRSLFELRGARTTY